MTQIEYRRLLIDSVRAGDYEDKDALLELLNICSLRFERTNVFTRNLWNHCKEYIQVCIVPDKMVELKKHFDYLKELIYEIYPPNDDYELWDVEIRVSLRVVGFLLLADYNNILITIVFINQMVYNILSVNLEVLYDYGRND